MNTDTQHIYGPTFSNFVRSVMIVCEENKLAYTVGTSLNGQEVKFKGADHLKMHPFGKIPVLIQDDFTLAETASICRYLDKDNQLQPSKYSDFAQHDALCAHISIDIDKVLVREYLLEFAFPKGEANSVRLDVVDKIKPKAVATLASIDKLLRDDLTLAGMEFSIADALLAPMLHYISCLPAPYNVLNNFPRLSQYLGKLMKRSSCQKTLIDKQFVL